MAAAEWEFVDPAMRVMVTNLVIAIHFRVSVLDNYQFDVISFSFIGLRNQSSFLFHNKYPEI